MDHSRWSRSQIRAVVAEVDVAPAIDEPDSFGDVAVGNYRVSDRGQMALPAETRRRWNLAEGGAVEVADLGDALFIVPAGRNGLRGLVGAAIEEAGGYASLAARVGDEDSDLA